MTHPEILHAERTGYGFREPKAGRVIEYCDCGRSIYNDTIRVKCSICDTTGCPCCTEHNYVHGLNLCINCKADMKTVIETINDDKERLNRQFKSEYQQKMSILRTLEEINLELAEIAANDTRETILCLAKCIQGRLSHLVKMHKERQL